MARTAKPVIPPAVAKAISASADPARAQHGFARLGAEGMALATLTKEHARILAAVVAGSETMGQLLLKHPELADSLLTPEHLTHPRQEQGLRREVQTWLEPALAALDYEGALAKLRQFKQREMLRIAARDLARLSDAAVITREISNVADICLQTALALCRQQFEARLGQPFHQDAAGAWHATQLVVLGLGKLGGQELNYSSDVDVLFVYSEEGHVFKEPPRRKVVTPPALTNHQFFKRLAEAFFAEITRTTSDGMLFRMDLRLRPEGETGPLVRSVASYENFYAQWGQTWERMMLIKARRVAGDASLAGEFLEMIQPFRYPRSLGEGALREIVAMKRRIESEVVRAGELGRNVKLGRGGIREIEFIVQTAQVLHAGRTPFLQGSQTLPLLDKLAQYQLLGAREAADLRQAYCFLRDVEHRVQMESNLQTHTIPEQPLARARLARLMGFAGTPAFEEALRRQTERVRELYEKLVSSNNAEPASELPRQFKGAESDWKQVLTTHRFRQVDQSIRLLNEFANGPGYVHVSQRTTELAMQLLPRLLALCEGTPARDRNVLSDPDRVVARLDRFITAYGARAILFETWTSHPQLFELLLLLFDRSEFLAEMAIRTPDLVDELVLSGRLGRSKSAPEILADLRHGWHDEDQRLWLRRYHQAEFMRLGLRSILGLANPEQNFVELTALAEACLQYALEAACRNARLKRCPVAVIGLGKLGGRELTYGSDLDVVFVAKDKAQRQLPKLQKLAVDMMDLLGAQTELGIAFVIDARLRPDGEKGLLVNTLAAYRDYYRHRAQLWEIQALTRSRPVAGDHAVRDQFQAIAAALTDFREPSALDPSPSALPKMRRAKPKRAPQLASGATSRPACYAPDWKQQIARMRRRIENERTPTGQDALAFKTGHGGLIDVEFVAQTLCLERGWREPNTLRALQLAREQQALTASDADDLIENYRELRRLEGILRRWSFEGEAVLPTDPAPFYRVSVRCGFETPEAFRSAVAKWRNRIREVYEKVFPPTETHRS